MFDQLVKRSNAEWIYNTGRFADERRIFLEEMIVQGYGLRAIRIITDSARCRGVRWSSAKKRGD